MAGMAKIFFRSFGSSCMPCSWLRRADQRRQHGTSSMSHGCHSLWEASLRWFGILGGHRFWTCWSGKCFVPICVRCFPSMSKVPCGVFGWKSQEFPLLVDNSVVGSSRLRNNLLSDSPRLHAWLAEAEMDDVGGEFFSNLFCLQDVWSVSHTRALRRSENWQQAGLRYQAWSALPAATVWSHHHAFMLRFAELGFNFERLPKLQQQAAASTYKQTAKSTNLIPADKAKLVTLRCGANFVWPPDFSGGPAFKTLHVSDLGSAEVKRFDQEAKVRRQQQLKACWNGLCSYRQCAAWFTIQRCSILGSTMGSWRVCRAGLQVYAVYLVPRHIPQDAQGDVQAGCESKGHLEATLGAGHQRHGWRRHISSLLSLSQR